MTTKVQGPIEARQYLGVPYGVEEHYNRLGRVSYIARLGASRYWSPAMTCASTREEAESMMRAVIDDMAAAGLLRRSA